MNIRPRQVKIPVASHYGGESRAALYKKAARYPGLFVKTRTKQTERKKECKCDFISEGESNIPMTPEQDKDGI
jgi:hypothetical protein